MSSVSLKQGCAILVFLPWMMGGVLMPLWSFAAEPTSKEVVDAWTTGLEHLTSEERRYLEALANARINSAPRKGIYPQPGAGSEIVRSPIAFDYVRFLRDQKKDLDARAKALVDQSGDRFVYLETGVSIEKARFESIDALVFELSFNPSQVSTFSQIPDMTTKEILKLGGETRLALSGDLTIAPVEIQRSRLSAKVGGEAAQKLMLEMQGDYTLERVLVSATGEGQPRARWMLDASRLIRDDVRFIGVLRVPKTVPRFSIDATAVFIDKLLSLELSRQTKRARYECAGTPLACVYVE